MTYEATVEDITIVDGVSVDVTVSGDEDKADKVMMDLKERLGRIGAAYDQQTPPDQLEILSSKYVPMMVVDWEGVFEVQE